MTKFRAAGKGLPLNDGEKKRHPPKSRYFTAIDSSSVKTVADRQRLAAYYHIRSPANSLSGSTNIDDLERS